MGGVRAKIGLTGQLDRRQPGNYFKPCKGVFAEVCSKIARFCMRAFAILRHCFDVCEVPAVLSAPRARQ